MTAVGQSGTLRVGYVSADLCAHPVGLFIEKVLGAHDAALIQPVIYCSGTTFDDISRSLQQSVQQKTGDWAWRDVRGLDDAALAAQIRADAIDILVDLSGHTANSRLAAFAWKPAPVQISWLGYFATTGLPTMDFVILDPYHAPPGTEAQFCERIIRLPHNRFCFQPVPFAPQVTQPPCLKNGFVTFGSFNNTAKLNQQVLEAWAKILKAVPNSRLILKWRTFADGPYCQRTTDFFVAQGIAVERLELRPVSTHSQLLEQYADIDIALDPFPFSGGHTSCEALWMGVPVVTLPQSRVVSRQTWSFLNNIGLAGLAAADEAAYVQLAANLANSPQTLLVLRQSLRNKMRASPLCDVAGFTRLLEDAYRVAWQEVTGNVLAAPVHSEQTLSPATRAEQLHQVALQAWQNADIVSAKQNLQAAIALNADVAAYHANLGVMLKQLGAGDERITCYQRAIELAPEVAVYYGNLAGAFNEAKRYSEGEAAARKAIALAPTVADYWFNLGSSLCSLERWTEGAQAFDTASEYKPNWTDAMRAAGESWREAGDWAQAGNRFHAALQTLPTDASATDKMVLLRNLGYAQLHFIRLAEAEQCFRQALVLAPQAMDVLTDLGNALKMQGKFDEALTCYQRVIGVHPESGGACCNLGTVFQSTGDYATAIRHYRNALKLDPTLAPVWGNLGNCMTYCPEQSPLGVLEAYQGFDREIAQPLRDSRPHTNDRNPERRLKVGYVSADFRKHAVAYFALPLLEGHDPAQIEIYCYYNHPQNDEWTVRFKAAAAHWVDCVGWSDAALAKRIRTDGIDILVDLSGHTDNNRLLTFARKPAPVQVTWMGYVTTTGMSAMDWRVTHLDADPQGVDAHYSEKLWRLPGTMWCYRPLPDMPEVSPPPLERKGYVTFGSFNRYSKNSPLVLETWATILNQVPNSRLLICVPEGSIRQQMALFFAERGINPERSAGFAKVSHEDFWKLHGEVDIALDPFPFGGGTTTCETLWLGVPLVTVTGVSITESSDTEGGVAGSAQTVADAPTTFPARFASRMGQAFLRNIGLPELVAETLPQYIDIAVQLARDAPRMAQLRQSLRPRMAAAPLTDEARFAREMEEAYRAMWRQWCRG